MTLRASFVTPRAHSFISNRGIQKEDSNVITTFPLVRSILFRLSCPSFLPVGFLPFSAISKPPPPPSPSFESGRVGGSGRFSTIKGGGEVPQKTGSRVTGTEGGNFFLTAASFPPASRGAAERIVPFSYGVWGGGGNIFFFLSFADRQYERASSSSKFFLGRDRSLARSLAEGGRGIIELK